jgi:hypothetical protein
VADRVEGLFDLVGRVGGLLLPCCCPQLGDAPHEVTLAVPYVAREAGREMFLAQVGDRQGLYALPLETRVRCGQQT